MLEAKLQCIFCGSRSFKSKEGKQFNIVSIIQLDADNINGTVSDKFVTTMPEIVSELRFGDVVEVTLGIESADSKPSLKSINRKVSDSPYKFI